MQQKPSRAAALRNRSALANTQVARSRAAARSFAAGQAVRVLLPESYRLGSLEPARVLDAVVVEDSRMDTLRVEVVGGKHDGDTHAVPRDWVYPLEAR